MIVPSQPLNLLLAALPEAEYQRLAPNLTTVKLKQGKVLYETWDEITTVYFPIAAVISLVSVLEDGATTEVGIVGRANFFGQEVVLGGGFSHNRAIIQSSGSLVKVSADIIKREFARGGKLQKLLLLGIECGLKNAAQLAVCNCHHTIEQRLARWLLQMKDSLLSDKISLTQEFLAKMLGVRRAGVTVAAQNLQKAGAIVYSRGNIMILDVEILQDMSCECYELQKAGFYRLFGSELGSISNLDNFKAND